MLEEVKNDRDGSKLRGIDSKDKGKIHPLDAFGMNTTYNGSMKADKSII